MSADAFSSEALTSDVTKSILEIRGQHVLVDCDVARFYKIETKYLNRIVKRNPNRFPSGCVFQLTKNEFEIISATNSLLCSKRMPWVFTEQGAMTVSAVLKSDHAGDVLQAIFSAFAPLKTQPKLSHDFDRIVALFDQRIAAIEQKLEQVRLGLAGETKAAMIHPAASLEENPVRTQNRSSKINAISRYHEEMCLIQEAVAAHYKVNIRMLRSPSRKKELVLPRQVGIYLIRKHTSAGLKEIGQIFGGRDHSTAVHAVDRIESLVEHDTILQADLKAIQGVLFHL